MIRRKYDMKSAIKNCSIPGLVISIIASIAACFGIGMVFFDNVAFALCTVPFAAYLVLKYIKHQNARYKRLMLERFRLFIGYLNASLQGTAKPVEKAFSEAVDEMRQIYSEKDIFLRHMIIIQKTLSNNMSRKIEAEFYAFAVGTGISDIIDFAGVLVSCKNTNTSAISKVIELVDELIGEKLNTQMDFRAMVQENAMVFNIMSLMPTAFIAFFNATMQDYLSPLYSGKGRIVMIAGLAFNIASYIIGNKFIERYDEE